MEDKPLHYDGSNQNVNDFETEVNNEVFEISDEARKSISGNPYITNKME